MTNMMGFGGVYFAIGGTNVEFVGAYGKPTFIPIQEELINDEDSLITRLHGFRVEIITDYIYNLLNSPDEITKYQTFAGLLSQLISSTEQIKMTIKPRYNSSYDNLSYDCILASKIDFEDIARIEAGQMIKLKWKAVDKVDTIPSFIHSTADTYVDDGADTYVDDGADTYVTEGT